MMELASIEQNPESTAISQTLEDYLTYVARSGNALFSWNRIKPLFKAKLKLVIQEFHDSSPTDDLLKQPNVDIFKFDQMKQRIFEQLESYSGIPFTVQRLCELLVQPKRHYKRTDKFMRGLEKIMLVVSTIDPNPAINGDTDTSQDSDESRTTLVLSQESPSKRPRLSLLSEEPGPCDSADEALALQAVTVEEVPSIDSSDSCKSNGIEDISTAEAEAETQDEPEEMSAGEENMDIDTECTSSQARLIVSEAGASSEKPAESVDGVESSAGVSGEAATDNMDIEPEVSDGVSTTETADTERAEAKENEAQQPSEEESGELHSSSEETPALPEVPETNSEAEPVDTGPEEVSRDDEDREVAPAVTDSPLENVQSSEERSESDSAVREDSGAADSSDEVTPTVVHTSDITETVTCSDTSPESGPSKTNPSPDTPDNSSPDQSLQQD